MGTSYKVNKKTAGEAEDEEQGVGGGESTKKVTPARYLAWWDKLPPGSPLRKMSLYDWASTGGSGQPGEKGKSVPMPSGVGNVRPGAGCGGPRTLALTLLRLFMPGFQWAGAIWEKQEGGPGQEEVDLLVEFAADPEQCQFPLLKAWAAWCEDPASSAVSGAAWGGEGAVQGAGGSGDEPGPLRDAEGGDEFGG